jgi:hypothetical protein
MRRFGRWIRSLLSRSERLQMWYLERDLARLRRDYHREMAEARDSQSTADPQEIEARYTSESDLAREELESVRTERIIRRARALRVPLPSLRPHAQAGDENWDLGSVMGQWTLTDEGQARLRRAIREEEKARRETAAFWIGILTGLIAVVTGLVGAATGLIAIQQKELSRLDHLPRISCAVVQSGGQDSLIVANSGSPVRKISVDRIVFFEAQPYSQPSEPQLVRYVIDDYYADQLGGDYEGNQQLAFGLDSSPGNMAFVRGLTLALADSLGRRGLGWAGIEVHRAVKVVYWDWLGTKMEECFWGNAEAGERPSIMGRISDKKWKELSATADAARRSGRRLRCATNAHGEDAQRMIRECVNAALR